MRRRPACRKCLLALCAWLAVGGIGAIRADGQDDWLDPGWQHRLTVEVAEPARRGGINTALLNLAELSQSCRPDGRDVRVIRAGGQPVPHRVRVRDNKTLDVLFHVPEDSSRFHVYYANPDAEKAEGEWTESLGGLFLETRPTDRPISRPNEIPGALRRYTAKFGRQPWGRIWDLENPFGRDDMYLSIYKGTLYCPETGEYVFAINADDTAFFSVEGLAEPLCWRDAGVPSMGWHDPNNPRAVRTIQVQKGVYHVRYYHVENYGAQLAKLGWQTPSFDTIVTVAKDAFVQYLPAEVLAREAQGESLSPFFIARHRYNLKVNGLEPGFPSYRFESRTPAGAGSVSLQYSWDFGDGTTASGPVVDHEFREARSHSVSLTVKGEAGAEAGITRPITPPGGPVRDITLRLHVESESQLIGPGSPLALHILAVGQGATGRAFELVTTAVEGKGAARRERTRSVPLGFAPGGTEGQYAEVEEVYPSTQDALHITAKALLHGVEVAREKIAVLRTDGPLTGLQLDRAQHLRDQEGALVVLRLSMAVRSKAPRRRVCEPHTGTVTVLAFDDMLGGPPGPSGQADYSELLHGLLSTRYPQLAFTFRRSVVPGQAECSPLQRLLHIQRTVTRVRANIVLLVCQPQVVINGLPLDEFEKCLAASVDQVLARCRAEVIIVAPPPVPGSPETARPYAQAAKRVGLRKEVPVVDLYSRFLLIADWESLFRSPPGRHPSLLLYPNAQGQEEIAREIYAAAIESFHRDFSDAVRRASLMRPARPGSAAP